MSSLFVPPECRGLPAVAAARDARAPTCAAAIANDNRPPPPRRPRARVHSSTSVACTEVNAVACLVALQANHMKWSVDAALGGAVSGNSANRRKVVKEEEYEDAKGYTRTSA